MERARELLAAVDTGGTYTDVVSVTGRVEKVLTQKTSLVTSVEEGLLRAVGSVPIDILAHGTTVATNALLERKGACIALVTNKGFADVIEIGRQTRPDLYDNFADRPPPLVPPQLRFEIACRMGPNGEELVPISESELDRVCGLLLSAPERISSVAVSLLHSYIDPSHEKAVAQVLRDAGFDVVISSEISPEYREYERTSTVVATAYLKPVLKKYLGELTRLAASAYVMTSAGGLVPADHAAENAAALLLSGPAGGAIAGSLAALECGFEAAVTFDMGGTSADICMIQGGIPEPTPQIRVGGLPIRLPSIEIVTIGAGGGSIARIDPGGALQVGPQSAGADPGPACYGRGGREFTVTDANLLTGRIPPGHSFPELGLLDIDAAKDAMRRCGTTPEETLAVVNANMERALRKVTAERGHDPSQLALVAFGGAGPLHACELAEALGMPAVVVPPRAGVLSALGLLVSPAVKELVKSRPDPLKHDTLQEEMEALALEAAKILEKWGFSVTETVARIDCRYKGQSFELPAASIADFHEVHRRRNGYTRPELLVEVTAVRAKAFGRPLGRYQDLVSSVVRKGVVRGPDSIVEDDCTVFVPKGWIAHAHQSGAWLLRRSA